MDSSRVDTCFRPHCKAIDDGQPTCIDSPTREVQSIARAFCEFLGAITKGSPRLLTPQEMTKLVNVQIEKLLQAVGIEQEFMDLKRQLAISEASNPGLDACQEIQEDVDAPRQIESMKDIVHLLKKSCEELRVIVEKAWKRMVDEAFEDIEKNVLVPEGKQAAKFSRVVRKAIKWELEESVKNVCKVLLEREWDAERSLKDVFRDECYQEVMDTLLRDQTSLSRGLKGIYEESLLQLVEMCEGRACKAEMELGTCLRNVMDRAIADAPDFCLDYGKVIDGCDTFLEAFAENTEDGFNFRFDKNVLKYLPNEDDGASHDENEETPEHPFLTILCVPTEDGQSVVQEVMVSMAPLKDQTWDINCCEMSSISMQLVNHVLLKLDALSEVMTQKTVEEFEARLEDFCEKAKVAVNQYRHSEELYKNCRAENGGRIAVMLQNVSEICAKIDRILPYIC